MKPIFCKVGLHWRMRNLQPLFIDVLSKKTVYEAVCPCGIHWMTDSLTGFPFFKVPMEDHE